MDIFSEQLVRKEKNAFDAFVKFAVYLGAFLIATAIIVIILMLDVRLMAIGFLAAFGVLYLGIYFSNNLSVEYEYIVTGTCLDIDKITGAKTRKRLVSADILSIELFGEYKQGVNLPECDTTVEAIYSPKEALYYAVFDDERLGRVLLLFNPDNKTLDTIDTSLPRSLRVFK